MYIIKFIFLTPAPFEIKCPEKPTFTCRDGFRCDVSQTECALSMRSAMKSWLRNVRNLSLICKSMRTSLGKCAHDIYMTSIKEAYPLQRAITCWLLSRRASGLTLRDCVLLNSQHYQFHCNKGSMHYTKEWRDALLNSIRCISQNSTNRTPLQIYRILLALRTNLRCNCSTKTPRRMCFGIHGDIQGILAASNLYKCPKCLVPLQQLPLNESE